MEGLTEPGGFPAPGPGLVPALDALAAPDLDALFQDAPLLDQDSAWFGHLPFASWLVGAARPRLLVELGTHNGVSYAGFCHAVRREGLGTRCFAVDTWKGDEQAGHYPEQVFQTLAAYHDRHFAGFSQMLRCTFDEALERFADGSVDLLHIDGLHTYEAVRHDFEAWRPKLSDRAVVLFHDTTERTAGFGVWRLWAELAERWPAFEFIHGHGLGVLCVGADVPAAVAALAAAPPAEADRLRNRFAFLGARWEAAWLAGYARRAEADKAARIDHLTGVVGTMDAEIAKLTAAIGALHEAQARSDRVNARARARVVELRARLGPLRQAAEATARGQQAAEAELAAVRAERDRMAASLAWRVTGPLRRAVAAMPAPARRHARRGARAVYWLLTPRRLPQRLRVLRARRAEQQLAEPPSPATADDRYAQWIGAFEPAEVIQIGEDPRPPLSLLLPTAGEDGRTAATLASIGGQTEADWTVVVPDTPVARQAVGALAESRRVVFVPCAPEADRGGVLDALLAAAPGRWVGVLDSGDVLESRALHWIGITLASEPTAAAVYCDEDVRDEDGRRHLPQFKPAWSPELLHAYNYFGRLAMLARDLALSCGGFGADTGAGAEWGLHLRLGDAAEAAGRPIRRLPAVLCHRPPGSDRERPRPGTRAATEHSQALHAYWTALGHAGVQVRPQEDGTQRSTWTAAATPLVSVVIPNRNGAGLLRRCLKGVLDKTEYRHVEVIVVENNSDDPDTLALYGELRARREVRVVEKHGPFSYSTACNHGARHARGALLLFLNNDVEVQDPGWLGELVRMAGLPGVGVVGTKLRYPDGVLQHGGVAAGPHLLAMMFGAADEREWGVFGSTNHTRNWSAVMGACQMVTREAFDRVGGFDEAFELANSDVMLCLRAAQLGFRTAYTPFAALVHHEGATRGRQNPPGDMARSARELRRLGMDADPFFHPGLSGNNPVPTLRRPGEASGADALRALTAQFLAAAPEQAGTLDLFDDAAVLAAADLPRAHVLPELHASAPIADAAAAGRWVVALLRSREDLRIRFPRALTDGRRGAFGAWLAAGTGGEMTLPPGLADHLDALWARDPATRPRQAWFWRDDVHAAHPAGGVPPGYARFVRYLFRDCQFEYRLGLEEPWWLLLSNAERPAAELVRAYRFNVAWQDAHPLGLTVFGRDAFATWFAMRHGVATGTAWLDPAAWPDLPDPAEQLRLAYARHPDWQARFPRALGDTDEAAALLRWLGGPAAGLPEAVRRWCAAQGPAVAAALAGPAVNVLGHFCFASGLRVSVEAMADAMEGAGVAVGRRDIRLHLVDDPPHNTFGALETADITLIHTQPGPLFLKCYARADLAERSPRTYRIGYWYWELEDVPPAWAGVAKAADEIWAATDFVADGLRKVVDTPVHVLFPGVQIAPFTPRPREALGAPPRGDGRFAFLYSFHMASIAERKNPLGLIRAFRRAFGAADPVDLVLKTTSEARHADEMAALQAAAAGANVTIIDRVFTPDETGALMDGCDAYVSLHRAEGLGLTMAEAMLLGKPVIATRYSGNLQFMDDGNSLLVDCTVRPLGRDWPPYPDTARWAEPSEAHAAALMRFLYENQAEAAALGRRGQDSVRDFVSLDKAGQRMAARLVSIRAQRAGGRR